MIRIILVVDDPNSAHDIKNRLQRMCYDVIALTATADEVTTRADELRPDVILMDVRLKGETDGIEVAEQIKSLHDIPIIFITANADEAMVRRAIAAEPDGFFIKPLDALELRAAIEVAIHRHGKEAKARESARRIRELTESLSEVIFEMDMAGNITFVNRAGLKEFGYTKEQVEEGMTLYDFVPPDKHEEIRESMAQAVIDEPSPWIEALGLRRDGSTFPVSVRASVIVREGVPVGIRGIVLNVTEQKRAEQKLEENERRIRELTNALPEVIFETDANGIVTFASAAMFTRYGWTIGEVEGKMNLLDVVAPFDRERARETISKKIQGEDTGWAEYTLIQKDGSTAPFDLRTMPIVRNGVYEGLRGIGIDITERKRAEAALIRSERRIREITDALPVVVYETDVTGRMTFVNATAFELFGYTKEELEAGMSIFQLIAPADLKRARATFRRRMRGEAIGRVEYRGLRKDGSTYPISIRSVPMKQDAAVVGQRGVILDFTELKQAEEGIKERTHAMEILNLIVTDGNRATDVQSFAEAATRLTCELLYFDAGTIHLVDDDARCANLRHAIGIPNPAIDAIRRIPLEEVPDVRFFAEPKPRFVDGHVGSLVSHLAELGLQSLATVPLYRYTKIVGTLTFGSFKRHTFSQTERELLVAIGNEAGAVITKLQADEALRESERRIRELTDALPEVVYETDATGAFSFVSASCLQMFGYTKEEFEAGLTAFDVLVPDDRDRGRKAFLQRMDATELGWIEYTGLRKDGSTLPVSVSAMPIHDDGAVIGTRGIVADNTQRKRSEERLRKSERRIREITDALPVVVYETDATGRMTFVNATAFELFGYTKQELEAGMSIFQLIAPADLKRARATFRRRMRGEDVGALEHTGLRKDGSTYPISIRSVPMKQDAAVVGQRGIIIDITERKTTELVLHEVQEELRQHATMFNAAHDAIMTLDPEGTITYWNRGAERLYGWTKQEAEGQNANALLRTWFPESREALWPKLMRSGLWEGELIHVTRDGVRVTVASSWTLMKDEAGNASAILEISSDVTERKKAESALAESEATLRITFATMADGIVIAGLDEEIIDCNEAILRLTQRSRDDIIGKPFGDLLPHEFRSLIPDARKLLIGAIFDRTVVSSGKKETVRTDSQLLRKNGDRVDIEANISLIEDASGQPAAFLTVARDVTERKRMESKLNRTLADLQRSNAELEQFAYVTSHDLQEPLRMITSYIQLICEDYKGRLDADADQYIAFAVEGAKRMHTLINDLLAYSRVGTRGEPFMPTSMNGVLSAAIANLEVAIEESHAVVTQDQLPTVLGDESQLIQLFQNLLGNAIKFRSDAIPKIHVGVEETKDDWVFSVRDNGIGIDMKYAERIFSVFQRLHTREDYPGTGIGLAIVRKIVERHGGRIWVESEPANGSTFCFTLPRGE